MLSLRLRCISIFKNYENKFNFRSFICVNYGFFSGSSFIH
jgi:hypothetical protein